MQINIYTVTKILKKSVFCFKKDVSFIVVENKHFQVISSKILKNS